MVRRKDIARLRGNAVRWQARAVPSRGPALWASGGHGVGPGFAIEHTDGNFILSRIDGRPLSVSGTGHRARSDGYTFSVSAHGDASPHASKDWQRRIGTDTGGSNEFVWYANDRRTKGSRKTPRERKPKIDTARMFVQIFRFALLG